MYEFESLDFRAKDRKMSAYLAFFEPIRPEKVKGHEHGGFEFIYVIEGRLGLTVDGEVNELGIGDSVYFDATVQHGYRALGRNKCTAVVVTTP